MASLVKRIVISFEVWLLSLTMMSTGYTHGGIPGVLDLIPPQTSSSETFWVIDTLGLFRGQVERMSPQQLEQRSWSWLCDDAVDPMLGVESLTVLDEQVLIAVARSGLYRSADNGCSFARLDSPINQFTIGSISEHPLDSSQLVIFTNSVDSNNRVWWTDDSGETWSSSNLVIAGGIFGLWRDSRHPETIWVNHADGISYSEDGGRQFVTLDEVSFSGASAQEVRLLNGGYIEDRLTLWASLDHYPTSSLLMSVDRGYTWREIHNLNDRYDDLALTDEALWVSSPYSGLFVYQLTESERQHEDTAWRGDWRQHDDLNVSCLTPDPLDPKALWACGRGQATQWLVGRTDDFGESWSILMREYQEASEGQWGCDDQSPSLMACSSRCLDEGCDPAQNNQSPETVQDQSDMMSSNTVADYGFAEIDQPMVSTMTPSSVVQESGCHPSKTHHTDQRGGALIIILMIALWRAYTKRSVC